MKRLTLEQIKKKLKYHRPAEITDLLIRCKLPLEFVGDGQFREVFRISGTPYAIKVPTHVGGLYHSIQEVRASKMLRKEEFSAIHPYLLTIHYSNRNTGIILTDFCKWASYAKNYNTIKEIHEWTEDQGFPDADVDTDQTDNYGLLGNQLKILVLGCFAYGEEC